MQTNVNELDVTFHNVLRCMLSEPSHDLVTLMNNKLEQMTGHRATDHQLNGFLKELGFRYRGCKMPGLPAKHSMPPEC